MRAAIAPSSTTTSAIVLQQRGQHAAALAEFRVASRQDPKFGPARLLAGASLLALGRPAEAATELERAVKLMPREIAPHLQLADACERLNNVPCLVAEYRAVVALAPGDPEYAYRLGKAYLRLVAVGASSASEPSIRNPPV